VVYSIKLEVACFSNEFVFIKVAGIDFDKPVDNAFVFVRKRVERVQ
jgi:hypothetical protein